MTAVTRAFRWIKHRCATVLKKKSGPERLEVLRVSATWAAGLAATSDTHQQVGDSSNAAVQFPSRPVEVLERPALGVHSPALVALTPQARLALDGQKLVRLTHFPFNIGRESRSNEAFSRLAAEVERRIRRQPTLNDHYLIDDPFAGSRQISRAHCTIDCVDGKYFVVDRKSNCGTVVGGKPIGGDRKGGWAELNNGDTIIIGTATSPYVFRFEA